MDCSLPGSSVHGIFQARVLEWGAISFSRDPQGSNPGLSHCRQTLYRLSHQGSHTASLALLSISCGSVFISSVVDPSAGLQVFLIAGRSK